ncbi:MAG TPA: Crp/Fnr family transcriptional regulator [Blastocatellia bacterium]|nr:Crp/Fnr family transcriptional regulator [Blastocatellia bacterium]
MKRRSEASGRRKHNVTDRMKTLAATALAQKIGYLKIENFPQSNVLAALPSRDYKPSHVIRCAGLLCIVSGGSVQIRHARHDYPVKELTEGALFGAMPLLGQTMLGTTAVAGAQGARVWIISADKAREWIKADPVAILKRLGARLAFIEDEHYRAGFQLADSRIAALLLELSRGRSVIKGWSHEKIGERLGLYRETVTVILDAMRHDKLIAISRMEITILDRRAMQALSEL